MQSNWRTQTAEAAGLAVLGYFAARAAYRKLTEYNLDGRVVAITGGSRGLGLVLARELAARGARIFICARDQEELIRAQDDLRARGADAGSMVADVTDRNQAIRFVRTAIDRFGKLDVLVNNAGVMEVGPMETMDVEDYERAMKLHFWAPLYAVLAALPHMKQRGQGRIVNIASIGGRVAFPHLLPYTSSKFALVGFSRGLRVELQRQGIAVTTIVPGLMRTGSPRNVKFRGNPRWEWSWFDWSDHSALTSISARSAAREIVTAIERGSTEVILSPQAKIGAKLDALFPEMTSSVLSMVNRALPNDKGEPDRYGVDFERTPSTQAVMNNEVLP